jgi:hypothetical protein
MGSDTLTTVGLPPAQFAVEPEMLETLEQAYLFGIFTKGNMARSHANPIAEAACRNWITTEAGHGVYGNRWLITEDGLRVLKTEQARNTNDNSDNMEKEQHGL